LKLIDFKRLGSEKGIGYSRDHLRRKCKAGDFPRPVAISDRRIAWIEAEVDAWLAAKKRKRDIKPIGGRPVESVPPTLD
jgi:prophage regulatory protein